jgi:molybdate transport repressor ModE-like protein
MDQGRQADRGEGGLSRTRFHMSVKAAAARMPICADPAPRITINLARLDLVSMRLLLECAERGSISGAAKHCHLSVMGASERLRRLEETLGKVLFYRHRGGLELTDAGSVAATSAKAVMVAMHQLVTDVQASGSSSPTYAENPGRRGKPLNRCVLPFSTQPLL